MAAVALVIESDSSVESKKPVSGKAPVAVGGQPKRGREKQEMPQKGPGLDRGVRHLKQYPWTELGPMESA